MKDLADRPDPALGSPTRTLARQLLYNFHALALSDPSSDRFALLFSPRFREMVCAGSTVLAGEAEGATRLRANPDRLAADLEVDPLYAQLARPTDELLDEYTRVMGDLEAAWGPREGSHCPHPDIHCRQLRLDDLARRYRESQVDLSPGFPREADHIGQELELMASLVMKERHASGSDGPDAADEGARIRSCQREVLEKHILWWIPGFARSIGRARPRRTGSGNGSGNEGAGSYLLPIIRSLCAFLYSELISFDIEEIPARDRLILPSTTRPDPCGYCFWRSELPVD